MSRECLLRSVGDQFVVAFGGKEIGSSDYARRVEDKNTPRDGAKNPALIERPADEEAVIVIVEESLQNSTISHADLCAPRQPNEKTYNKRHSNNLAHGDNGQQRRDHFPAALSLVAATEQHNRKGDNGRELEERGDAHQEPDAAPHGAEVAVFAMAVFVLRERRAAARQTRAALVQAVRHVDAFIRAAWDWRCLRWRVVGDPIRKGDCGETQCGCWRM